MAGRVQGIQTFLEECWAELMKVTWPDKEQLRNATLVIIVFVIGVSGVIWFMDLVVRKVVDIIMGIFGV